MEGGAERFRLYGGSTPVFSLNNMKTQARVVSIYDGDTLHAVIPVLGSYFKFSVRLHGIDTCEMKSKVVANKEKAVQARNRIIELVTKKPFDYTAMKTKKQIEELLDSDVFTIWLHCLEMDKYGRVLAKAFASPDEETSFSDVLVNEGLAYEYFGDGKKTEEEQARSLRNRSPLY